MPRLASGLRPCWLFPTLLIALLGASGGCSAVVSPDVEGLGPRPAACEPGSLNPFTCPDTSIVNQICNDQGGYAPAVCPPTACEPSTTWPCRCADGSAVTRTCQADSTWPTCPCNASSPPAAGSSGG